MFKFLDGLGGGGECWGCGKDWRGGGEPFRSVA